jgi:hypothetical protein
MAPADIGVEVVFAPAPHELQHAHLRLPMGATAADALRACGLPVVHDSALLDSLSLGIWGRLCAPDTVLRDRDRLELTRGLQVDPKEARRQRYRKDGVKKRVTQRPRR